MHRQRLGTRQVYHTTVVAVGLGVMVKGSRYQGQDISVWICQRRLYLYTEWIHMNEWKWKETRSRVKETNSAEKKAWSAAHSEAGRPWGGIRVKLFVTPLLCSLEHSLGHAWGVLNCKSFQVPASPHCNKPNLIIASQTLVIIGLCQC